jgi:hypothetical protein
MTEAIQAKARRLVSEGRVVVRRVDERSVSARVRGDEGFYVDDQRRRDLKALRRVGRR